MGTKVSKNQGDTASKKVKAVAAFQLAGQNTKLKRAAQLAKAKTSAKVDVKKVDLNLPARQPSSPAVADHACVEASTSCGFPVPSIIDTKFNVNAKHGGGTALLLLTRGKKDSDSSELTLLRCGFDGNHYSIKTLAQGGEHSIYNWNEVFTDPQGFLQPKLIYGQSYATVLSNLVQFGHGGCGVLFEGPKAGVFDSTASIVPTPPISSVSDADGSCALVICSAQPDKSGAVQSQTCLVHFQRDGNVKQVPLVPEGSDKFIMRTYDGKTLEICGPSYSHYVVFHSKSAAFAEAHRDKPKGKVVHLQEFSGINPTTLLEDASSFVGRSMLVMCSHSLQDEDSTTSALYQVTLMKGQAGVAYIAGMSGVMQSADVWTISMKNGKALQIVGPKGPCRYSLFTNIAEDVPDRTERCVPPFFLATGDTETIEGGLIINDDNLTIWVDSMTKVLVTCDGVTIQEVEGENWMEQPDGRLAFQRELTEKEKSPGLRFYRAFAVLKDRSESDAFGNAF